MSTGVEKRVFSLGLESKVDYYIEIIENARRAYEKAFRTGSYPPSMVRASLESMEATVHRLAIIKSLLSRYRLTLLDHYLEEALREARGIRYSIRGGLVYPTIASKLEQIVSEIEYDLRSLLRS